MKIEEKIKSECRECNGLTNHIVKAIECTSYSSDEFSYSDEFAIVQCLGCETLSFRKEYTDSESFSYDDHNDGYSIKIYPSPKKVHQPLADQWMLPASISLVYNESVNALIAGCNVLAGIGFRTIIEAVCLDKKVIGRDLETKINNLSKKGFITQPESARLHSIRFIGNDSAHEMKIPKPGQPELVLHIIENLLSNLYIIDNRAKEQLESIITDYTEFVVLLNKAIKKFPAGEEISLYKVFGKDFRRIKGNLQIFETQLISDITSGFFKPLSVVPKLAPTQGAKPATQKFKIA